MFDLAKARFKAAIDSVSTLYVLIALGVGSLSALAFNTSTASCISVATLAFLGALEILHRQTLSNLKIRQHENTKESTLITLGKASKSLHPKELEQFNYCGFKFITHCFVELPIALSVTSPLCPTCGGQLAERANVIFPCITSIEFVCACGFSNKSKLTKAELVKEVSTLKGVR